MPLVALRFEGEEEAQPITSRFTSNDWENVARVNGVFIDGVGYGVTTTRSSIGPLDVTIAPAE